MMDENDFDKTYGNETEAWYHVGTTDEPSPPDERQQAGFVLSYRNGELTAENLLTGELTDAITFPLTNGDKIFVTVDGGLFEEVMVNNVTVYKRA